MCVCVGVSLICYSLQSFFLNTVSVWSVGRSGSLFWGFLFAKGVSPSALRGAVHDSGASFDLPSPRLMFAWFLALIALYMHLPVLGS